MSWIVHRFIDFVFSLFFAFVVVMGLQWILSWGNHTIPGPWDRILFLVLTVWMWNPFKKEPPHNSGNNDLFPGV